MLTKIFKIKGAYVFYILGLFILLSASLVFTKAFAATDNISGSKPIEVKIALQIDQISDVNQKARVRPDILTFAKIKSQYIYIKFGLMRKPGSDPDFSKLQFLSLIIADISGRQAVSGGRGLH
jgi:hypothetical protein